MGIQMNVETFTEKNYGAPYSNYSNSEVTIDYQ